MIGRTLSHYKVLEKIGEGGMGEVYLAKDTKLDREVAVKVLPATFSENKERLARFEREAKLLASLNHPNIAAIHELEECEGVHFLALELVPGETLAERIKRGPIPIDEALPLFKQIAEGLEAAHEKGVIHRDLKPANIKVTPEGKVKVLDFGLAKALAGEKPAQGLSESPTITRDATETGVLLGTAPYMSPEQARGKPVDKRTDIWAFGCCLYEALTGETAYLGETVSDTLVAVLEREPHWEALPEETPTTIRSLLRRCLRKDGKARLHDMADARIEIEEAIAEPSLLRGEPVRVSNVQKWRVAVPWFVGVLVGGLAIWALMRGPVLEPKTPIRFAIATPPLVTNVPSPQIAVSPDGTKLVYVAEQEGKRQVYLQEIGQMEATPIEGTENGLAPFFSPDGQWVGFGDVDDVALKKVSLRGGLPLTVFGDVLGAPHWGPDDTIFFVHGTASGSGIKRISAAGGTEEVLIRPRAEKGEWALWFPEVLPGGKEVLFISQDGSSKTLRVEVQSLETGDRKTLMEGGSAAHYASSGHLVYAEAGSILAAPFDLARLELTGAPVPVLEDVRMTRHGDNAHFSFSRTGTLAYVPGGEQHQRDLLTLVWVDRKGKAEPMTDQRRLFTGPRLSPAGDRIAMWLGGGGGNAQVWVYEMERGTLTPLTSEGQSFFPIWSPDGKHLVFPSMRSGGVPNLFWKSADGSDSAERLTSSEFSQQPYSWSSDGRVLFFHQSRDPETGFDIWVLPIGADGNPGSPEPFLQTPSNEMHPALSPDGQWLAYVSDASGSNEVFVTPFPGPGAKVMVSTGGGVQPAWAPSGRELFYREQDPDIWLKLFRMMVVDIVTQPKFRPGKARALFEGPYDPGPGYGRGYDITSDGQRFVMIKRRPDESGPQQINVILNWFEELKRLVPTN